MPRKGRVFSVSCRSFVLPFFISFRYRFTIFLKGVALNSSHVVYCCVCLSAFSATRTDQVFFISFRYRFTFFFQVFLSVFLFQFVPLSLHFLTKDKNTKLCGRWSLVVLLQAFPASQAWAKTTSRHRVGVGAPPHILLPPHTQARKNTQTTAQQHLSGKSEHFFYAVCFEKKQTLAPRVWWAKSPHAPYGVELECKNAPTSSHFDVEQFNFDKRYRDNGVFTVQF